MERSIDTLLFQTVTGSEGQNIGPPLSCGLAELRKSHANAATYGSIVKQP